LPRARLDASGAGVLAGIQLALELWPPIAAQLVRTLRGCGMARTANDLAAGAARR
jgi:hypothetical protein